MTPIILLKLWPFAVAAAVLGLAATAVGGPGARLISASRWSKAAALALVVLGVALSAVGFVPGRPGLWFDISAPIAAAYAVGCLLGVALRRAARRRPAVDAEQPAA